MRNFILGTDWWTDCDDAVALRILARAHKEKKICLKGIGISACMEYSVASVDGFLSMEGISGIPLGIDCEATDFGGKPPFQKRLAKFATNYFQNSDAEDVVKLYRKILSTEQEPLEIIDIGYLQVLTAVLESQPDDISDKTGMELIQEKVSKIWIMAGKWDEVGGKENNFCRNERSRDAAEKVCRICPVTITFLGWEIGDKVITGDKLDKEDFLYNALCDHGSYNGRSSWDPMLVQMAIIGDEEMASYDVVKGTARVDRLTGANYFEQSESGRHQYVVCKYEPSYYQGEINMLIKSNVNQNEKIPMLGTAYYPEAWDESEQERDIALMQKAGLKVVRMAEFAWSKMEPAEGEFHFEWLHGVIDKLEDAGIKVILGTPSATPPIWLEEKDPSMMVVYENDCRAQHGARRKNCSNNLTYRKYAARITEKMAIEFGADSRVIGWQIDNEIEPLENGCFCHACKKKFAEHLRQKYGTIENLNQRWNLNLWSQNYDKFEQVPMPKSHTFHNPHLMYEWKEFQSDSHVDFVKMQIDILRKYTKAPIGTDMMPRVRLNYEKIAELVDVMQFNQYFDEKHMDRTAFWYDYIRTFKDMPFWNTETSTCWNGSVQTPATLRPEGFCRANSWLPIILGGGATLYWLWRQHWAGHELMHGSVLSSSGRPLYMFHEVQEVSEGFQKASDFLEDTKVMTDTAMMFSIRNKLLFEVQPIAPAVKDGGSFGWYRHLTENGIRPDIIAPSKELSKYKLLFTPYQLTLEENDLQQRIQSWVKEGGTWVVGPLSDIRNEIGAHYTNRETGILEAFTECQMVQQLPDAEHRITCSWEDGSEYKAKQWLQLFDLCDDSESLVEVAGGFSTLVGKSVVFKKQIGQGSVIVIGGCPEKEDAKRLLDIALQESGADSIQMEGHIVAARRTGKAFEGIAAQEIGGNFGKLYFEGEMLDLLNGETYINEVEFASYQTRILVKK